MNINKPEFKGECAFFIENNDLCFSSEIKGKLKKIVDNLTENKVESDKKAVDFLKKKFNCNNESCLLQKSEIKREIGDDVAKKELERRFKPSGPWDSTQWFSNFNIDEVLEQFTKKYKSNNFLHIPFQMRDFESIGTELATVDLSEKYKAGMGCFGVVLNTDKSTGRGQHWFCIFGDFRKEPFTIEYFNSSGSAPLNEVQIWMKKTKNRLQKNLRKPINDIIVSRIRHQTDNHSCGSYSIYYILSRLENIPKEYFKSNRVCDKLMHKFRSSIFRKDN